MKHIMLFEEFYLNELEFKDVESFKAYKSGLKRGMRSSTKVTIAGKETTVGDIEKSEEKPTAKKQTKSSAKEEEKFNKLKQMLKQDKVDPDDNKALASFIYHNHKAITGKHFEPEEESDFNEKVYDFIEKLTGKDAKEWYKENGQEFNDSFADQVGNTPYPTKLKKLTPEEEEKQKKRDEEIEKINALDIDKDLKLALKKRNVSLSTDNEYDGMRMADVLTSDLLNIRKTGEKAKDGDKINPKIDDFLKKTIGKSYDELPEDYKKQLDGALNYNQKLALDVRDIDAREKAEKK